MYECNTPKTPHSPMDPEAYAPIAYHSNAASPLLPLYTTPKTPHSPMDPEAYAPIAYHSNAASPLLPLYNTPKTPHSPMDPEAYAPIAYHSKAASPLLPLYNLQIRNNYFDQFITAEVARHRTYLAEEEWSYVKEKLAANPVEYERRTRSPNNSGGESSSRSKGHPEPTTNFTIEQEMLLEQRALWRKYHINNKLKTTRLQYRNEFMSTKVAHMKIELSQLESQMKIAERKFLAMGRNKAELAQLRAICGIDDINFASN